MTRSEPWIDRKRRYLQHLPDVSEDAILRVALADKVHNARSIVRDYRQEVHPLWERFTQKTAREQLWYYGALLAFFQEAPARTADRGSVPRGRRARLVGRPRRRAAQQATLLVGRP